jgi:hypothetical protein
MSLPTAIRNMLTPIAGVSNDNIVYGTRNQGMSIPCVIFTITSQETLTIGSNALKKCEVLIKTMNTTSANTQTLADTMQAALSVGTYDTIVFNGIIIKNTLLEEPTSGNGEETNPFVHSTTIEIYFTE